MSKLDIYCMSLYDSTYEIIKDIGYIPVGLKNTNFSKDWLRDNTLKNISKKNPYYGEYTFYYWYWKNLLNLKDKNNKWVGFCSYREYWGNKNQIKSSNLKDLVLREPHEEWNEFDTIIGEPIFVGDTKLIKMLKYGKFALLRNPKSIFSKKGKTIRWQFDMFHGAGNLDKAIELLPDKDRDDFRHFTRNENSFSRGNMFITKSPKIMNDYFTEVFEWLNSCEKIFGFDLEGYGKIRIYGFLAERFLSFWFSKNYRVKELPILVKDISSLTI